MCQSKEKRRRTLAFTTNKEINQFKLFLRNEYWLIWGIIRLERNKLDVEKPISRGILNNLIDQGISVFLKIISLNFIKKV